MATYQERNGRCRVQIRRKDMAEPLTKTFDTKKDAEKWARGIERQLDLGDFAGGPTLADGTFGPLLKRYRAEMWPVKPWGDSKECNLTALDRHFGDMTLAAMNKATFVDYAKDLSRTLAPDGMGSRFSYLRTVFSTAEQLWDARTPLRELEKAVGALRHIGLIGNGEERTREPLQSELDTLIQYARDRKDPVIDMEAIIQIQNLVPLRIGELCAIEWPDLDHEQRAVRMHRKHPDSRVKKRRVEVVPLVKVGEIDTFEIIANRPRYLARPYPYKVNSVCQLFSVAIKFCRINDLVLHDFRAGAITSLFAFNVSIPVVASISGHKDWKVLQKHYARIKPHHAHAAVARAYALAKLMANHDPFALIAPQFALPGGVAPTALAAE